MKLFVPVACWLLPTRAELLTLQGNEFPDFRKFFDYQGMNDDSVGFIDGDDGHANKYVDRVPSGKDEDVAADTIPFGKSSVVSQSWSSSSSDSTDRDGKHHVASHSSADMSMGPFTDSQKACDQCTQQLGNANNIKCMAVTSPDGKNIFARASTSDVVHSAEFANLINNHNVCECNSSGKCVEMESQMAAESLSANAMAAESQDMVQKEVPAQRGYDTRIVKRVPSQRQSSRERYT